MVTGSIFSSFTRCQPSVGGRLGNQIGVNNLRTSEGDPDTTGVYLGDASPLAITVAGNVISGDHVGIFAAGGPVTVHGTDSNRFRGVAVKSASTPNFS